VMASVRVPQDLWDLGRRYHFVAEDDSESFRTWSMRVYSPGTEDTTTPDVWVTNSSAPGYGPAGLVTVLEASGFGVREIVEIPYQANEALEKMYMDMLLEKEETG